MQRIQTVSVSSAGQRGVRGRKTHTVRYLWNEWLEKRWKCHHTVQTRSGKQTDWLCYL